MSALYFQTLGIPAQAKAYTDKQTPSLAPGYPLPQQRSLETLASSYVAPDFVSLLRMRSREQPDKLAYSYQSDRGEVRLTYGELDLQARAVAAQLQALGGANARALLLYPPGQEFLAGFFGCLYAGVTAVPAYPPQVPARPQDRAICRILAIASDASPRFVLTTAAVRARIQDISGMLPGIEAWISSDVKEGPGAEAWEDYCPTPESLAFLQYTSGSTGTPKGVMVSHGNLIHNESMIATGFGHSERSVVGGWLPVFHDMGLIGQILQPMFIGVPSYFMSPQAFVRRPYRWLELISRHRITTSGAPDFAYRLLAETVTEEEKTRLDLSCWDLAYTGAEPVRPETLERFCAAFASCGFRRNAFYPTYGLAEATLFVSGGKKEDLPVQISVRRSELECGKAVEADPADASDTRVLVGCGKGAVGQRLVIINPDTRRPVSEGEVGEIWISGPNMAGGYWNHEQGTAERFGVAISGSEDRAFYRTGDLGFQRGGELFFTGRLSDLMVIRGLSYNPEDVEMIVERVDPRFLMPCALSMDVDGEERLILVQEVSRGFKSEEVDTAAAAVRRAIAQSHQLELHTFMVVPRGTIPRTSSGKVQRRVCRERFLNGQLETEVIGKWSLAAAPAPAPGADGTLPLSHAA